MGKRSLVLVFDIKTFLKLAISMKGFGQSVYLPVIRPSDDNFQG